MPGELKVTIPIDPESIAKGLALLGPTEVAEFARDLMEQLWHQDETLVDSFVDGVNAERSEQEAA